MAKVTLKEMENQLLTLDQVHTLLQKTEPLSEDVIESSSKVKFKLDADWAMGLDSLDGTEVVGAYMSISGAERRMTKDATLQAAANFGLSAAYIKKVPAHLIEGLLNYHYGNGMGETEFKVLGVGENVAAFTRPTLQPFSNLQLLENAIEGIQQRHGTETPIFADYKINNSLLRTDVRLILPAEERTMQDTNMPDVPDHSDDVWMAGVHLTNSIVGKTQTSLEAYLFRWWCTNGATTLLEDVGVWNRRVNGQEEDVYAWARDSVDEVLGGLEARFDEVQALAYLNIAGNTADVLREVFSQYEVPVSQRDQIIARMVETENPTMYSVMNAITQVANEEGLDPRRADRLMRIGGAIPTETFDTLKARVWREGHTADPNQPNPYEIRVVS